MLTQEYVRHLFFYNPEAGVLRWRVPRKGVPQGKPITGRQVMIDTVAYATHNVIWLWVTGEWPKNEVDHRDGNHSNNKWGNLRAATHQQNSFNRRGWSAVGLKGVHRAKKRFGASIMLDGKARHLGTFDTSEQAHKAYKSAAADLFGEYAKELVV